MCSTMYMYTILNLDWSFIYDIFNLYTYYIWLILFFLFPFFVLIDPISSIFRVFSTLFTLYIRKGKLLVIVACMALSNRTAVLFRTRKMEFPIGNGFCLEVTLVYMHVYLCTCVLARYLFSWDQGLRSPRIGPANHQLTWAPPYQEENLGTLDYKTSYVLLEETWIFWN